MIVKMKKLTLLAPRSERDALLKELMLLGCVEISEQDELLQAEETAGALSREIGDGADWRAKKSVLDNALALLKTYAPKKTPLLAPKPEVQTATFLDESELDKALTAAREIVALDEKLRACAVEENKLRLTAEMLSPWRGLDVPLESAGTRQVALALGTVPASVDIGALTDVLYAAVPESQVYVLDTDKTQQYLEVLYLREKEDEALPILREAGFAVPAFGSAKGTAAENLKAVNESLEKLQSEKAVCQAALESHGQDRELLQLSSDRVNTHVDRAEAADRLLKTDSVCLLSGWAVAEEEEALKALLERFGCAYELSEPEKEEYPSVPVKLKNNKLTEGLNMVTDMYSLPQYGTVDPNPVMAPFFILFYGIMMADMGYGLIMAVIGLLIMLKKKPKEGFIRYFGMLMIEGGIATFIMGALTGGFLGDAPYWVVHLLNKNSTWEGIPAIIDPLNNTVMVLIGALILGVIHLNYGMVVSFVMKVKNGEVKNGICEEGALWALVIFVGLHFLVGSVGGFPLFIVLGVAAFLVLSAMGSGVGGALVRVYNEVTGWFGDILSYARLMALMLAGGVTAQVFNQLGAMPGNIVIFLIICLVGNTLNFGLNLLGCYVHDLRLQCLELFNKFYVAGGKAFAPLRIRSKYYDVVK